MSIDRKVKYIGTVDMRRNRQRRKRQSREVGKRERKREKKSGIVW